MKYFLATFNQQPTAQYRESTDELLKKHLRRTRIAAYCLERLLWCVVGFGVCALFAYILAEAAFGAGSIVQFPAK